MKYDVLLESILNLRLVWVLPDFDQICEYKTILHNLVWDYKTNPQHKTSIVLMIVYKQLVYEHVIFIMYND